MGKKDQKGWKRAALFAAVVLSGWTFFPHVVQAQEDTGAEDPYLVDNFEGYDGESAELSRVWATGGEENSSYTISLSSQPVYEGGYAMKLAYRQTTNGWGGCEIAKAANWSGCNALQFWIAPDGKRQRILVQINTASEGTYEADLLDYPEYVEADTSLLVTIPFYAFINPVSGKGLTSEEAAEIYSMGFWINAMPKTAFFDQDGYLEGALYFDGIRAINAADLQEPVLERWSEGRFLGKKASESDADEDRRKKRMMAVTIISGIIFMIAFNGFVTLALAGKRKRGVSEDGNSEKQHLGDNLDET